MSLTAVSLFAGVGGFDLAMQRHGIKTVATVEIDKHARKVLQRHFPEAQHFEDVTNVTGQQLRDAGFIPQSGVITGGFPCQDLSVAGKRAGLAGGRSGLFWEIIRICDELRPKYLVLENVPGLLSSNGGRDFGTVLGALVELGYGVSWSILDAQFFGVPQRRRRVFIVGCLGDDGRASAEILALPESLRGDFETSDAKGEESPADAGRGAKASLLTMREGCDGGGKGPLISEEMSLTLATGNGQVLIQTKGARSVVGQNSQVGSEIPRWESPSGEVGGGGGVVPTLNQFDNTGDSRATVIVFDSAHESARIQGDVLSTLNARMGTGGNQVPMAQHGSIVRRLTPVECTRLQGFPDSWQEIDNANATEAHADQILQFLWLSTYEKAREGWRPGIASSLLTPEVLLSGVHGNWISWQVAGKCASSRGALQGAEPWPKGFLLEMRRCSEHRPSPYQRESFGQLARELGRPLSEMPLGRAQAREALLNSELWEEASQEWPLRYARSETESWSSPRALTDGHRYKQMGNAVCVNVVEWIMDRLVTYEGREE